MSTASNKSCPGATWRERDGYRVCSMCGAIDPAQVLERLKEGYAIGPTDKSYKFYLHDKDEKLIGKGYFYHFNEQQAVEFALMDKRGEFKILLPGYFYSGVGLGDYLPAIEAAFVASGLETIESIADAKLNAERRQKEKQKAHEANIANSTLKRGQSLAAAYQEKWGEPLPESK